MSKMAEFERDIAFVINKHGIDSFANMPDFILAHYITTCLAALKRANEEKQLHETR